MLQWYLCRYSLSGMPWLVPIVNELLAAVQEADANLIAAAPEMLKALEHNCRTNCQRRMLYTGDKLPLSKTRDCVGCPMGKAINRAKGLLKQRRKRLMSAVKKGATHDN